MYGKAQKDFISWQVSQRKSRKEIVNSHHKKTLYTKHNKNMKLQCNKNLNRSIMAFSAIGVLLFSSCASDSEKTVSTVREQITKKQAVDTAEITDTTHRYDVKSGIVHYKPMTMSPGVTVKQTIYFDDFGKREIRESRTSTTVAGSKTNEHSISILDGDYTYSYIKEKTVDGKDVTPHEVQKLKLSNEAKTMLYLFGSGLAAEALKKYDYREEGTEIIAGFEGKKQSLAPDKKNKSVRIYAVTYKNIPLKTDMPDFKIEAEKFEENAAVDADLFELPSNYTVIDITPKN